MDGRAVGGVAEKYGGGLTMPIYVYRCEACGRVTEQLRNIGHRDRVELCPFCEVGGTVAEEKRVTSRSNFQFRGGSPTESETK